MNDQEAIVLLKSDNHEAFEYLYKVYCGQVYNFSRLYINSSEDIKEIVQEVFIKLWETRSFLRENDNLKGYLFIVTRNLIFNRQKKAFNENFYKTSVLSAYAQLSIDSCNIEEELQAKELNKYIDKIIAELPPKQQEIFILSRKENLSYKEIAQLMNISEKTVEAHIYKAIRHIKSRIELLIILWGIWESLN